MKTSEGRAFYCSQETKRMSLFFVRINELLLLLTVLSTLHRLTKLLARVCQPHYLHDEHVLSSFYGFICQKNSSVRDTLFITFVVLASASEARD